MPGIVTLFLLSFIGTWNNYFLPLVLLGTESRFPLTVGLSAWLSSISSVGRPAHLPRDHPGLVRLGPADAHPVPLPAEICGKGPNPRSDCR